MVHYFILAIVIISTSAFSQLDLGATTSSYESANWFCHSYDDLVTYAFDIKEKKIWHDSYYNRSRGTIGMDYIITNWTDLDCESEPCFYAKAEVAPFHMKSKLQFHVNGEKAYIVRESFFRKYKVVDEYVPCTHDYYTGKI